jgi:hypothetical protein
MPPNGWPKQPDPDGNKVEPTHPRRQRPHATVYLHHYCLRTLTEQSAACYQRADTAAENTIAATSSVLARDRGIPQRLQPRAHRFG